ncbi:MAG: hypothetical protein R2875_05915 [Desulfobacterales bacterium]
MRIEHHFLAGVNVNNGEERNSEEYSGLGVSTDHSDTVKRLLKGTPDVETALKTELMLGYMNKCGIFSVSLEYHPITWEMTGEGTGPMTDLFLPVLHKAGFDNR